MTIGYHKKTSHNFKPWESFTIFKSSDLEKNPINTYFKWLMFIVSKYQS